MRSAPLAPCTNSVCRAKLRGRSCTEEQCLPPCPPAQPKTLQDKHSHRCLFCKIHRFHIKRTLFWEYYSQVLVVGFFFVFKPHYAVCPRCYGTLSY